MDLPRWFILCVIGIDSTVVNPVRSWSEDPKIPRLNEKPWHWAQMPYCDSAGFRTFISGTDATWHEAKADCEKDGMLLASVAEQHCINEVRRLGNVPIVWFGVFRNSEWGPFRHAESRFSLGRSPTKWTKNQPTAGGGDCVAFWHDRENHEFGWRNDDCSRRLPFVCMQDHDECLDERWHELTLTCEAPFLCYNTFGSFECRCPVGYVPMEKGKLTTCIDDNECMSEVCGRHALCDNTNGSYTCTCLTGFRTSTAALCVDIDECSLGGRCFGLNSACINMFGSYRCTCASGYEMDKDRVCKVPKPTQPSKVFNGENKYGTMPGPVIADVAETDIPEGGGSWQKWLRARSAGQRSRTTISSVIITVLLPLLVVNFL